MEYKINIERKLRYVALDFTTGLTDLTIAIREPDGSLFSPAPVFTEIGDGLYETSYTPNALGIWQEKISSISNQDKIFNSINIVSKDIDTVSFEISVVESKIDEVKGKIDSLDIQIKPGGYIA